MSTPRRIERFLRQAPGLHAYELGDLDPAFAHCTQWFVSPEGGAPMAVALLYTASAPATLLCLCDPVTGFEPARSLLREIAAALPDALYAHLTPGLSDALPYRIVERSQHLKMALASLAWQGPAAETVLLGPEGQSELEAFYREAYPDNWFNPRMLALEPYVGLREEGQLVAVAGLHVWSERFGVAALGNIAVQPAARGRGLAVQVTAALCQRIMGRVRTLALNVAADNAAAIRSYERVGFVTVAPYEEIRLTRS